MIELFGDPDRDPIPLGIRVGNLVHASRILGTDPETGRLGEGIERQMELAYQNMRRLVEEAGGTTDNVAQVSFFLKSVGDTRAINPPWVAMFPNADDRPTYKFMAADLPGDRLVQLEMWAVIGGKRQVLNIPGVAHMNPIPMGVTIGRYLFSSRILPNDPETGRPGEGIERQVELVFGNMRTLLQAAGAEPRHVAQARVFVQDRADLPIVERHWRALFAREPQQPVLHTVAYRGAPASLVFVEIIAALE